MTRWSAFKKRDDSLHFTVTGIIVDFFNWHCDATTAFTLSNFNCVSNKFFRIFGHLATSCWIRIQKFWCELPGSILNWEATTLNSLLTNNIGVLFKEIAYQASMDLTIVSLLFVSQGFFRWLNYDVTWFNVSAEFLLSRKLPNIPNNETHVLFILVKRSFREAADPYTLYCWKIIIRTESSVVIDEPFLRRIHSLN